MVRAAVSVIVLSTFNIIEDNSGMKTKAQARFSQSISCKSVKIMSFFNFVGRDISEGRQGSKTSENPEIKN